MGSRILHLRTVSAQSKVSGQQASGGKALILPPGFTIPPADMPCILTGNKVDLQCLIANDPDFIRIRAEEAGLEAQALAAAQSGTLDPFQQVQTLGKLEIFDPKLARKLYANIYSAGGKRDPAKLYKAFRGRQPKVQALLEKRGLAA